MVWEANPPITCSLVSASVSMETSCQRDLCSFFLCFCLSLLCSVCFSLLPFTLHHLPHLPPPFLSSFSLFLLFFSLPLSTSLFLCSVLSSNIKHVRNVHRLTIVMRFIDLPSDEDGETIVFCAAKMSPSIENCTLWTTEGIDLHISLNFILVCLTVFVSLYIIWQNINVGKTSCSILVISCILFMWSVKFTYFDTIA